MRATQKKNNEKKLKVFLHGMNLESILNKELKMAEKENWVSIENKIHTHTHSGRD